MAVVTGFVLLALLLVVAFGYGVSKIVIDLGDPDKQREVYHVFRAKDKIGEERAIDHLDSTDALECLLRFPNGMGYRFNGADYLTRFALPNFLFHATTAYAILRNQGVSLGKPDFLQHLGMPEQIPEA